MKTLSEVLGVGKLVGSRGSAFRRTSTSKPDDWKDHSGKDVGAMRNFAHERAAVAKAEASRREREAKVEKRNKDAAQRAKETLRMAKEDLEEAKGKFVYDKPLKAQVAAMDKHSTDALKGMHDRWASDHKDMKSNPAHSERLLAAHHVLKNRGVSVPDLPQHKNLGMVRRFTTEATESSGTEARVKIKNVARPDDAPPTSEKSLLSRNGEIKVKKVDEEIAAAISRKYGLTDSILEAARAVMEKKTQVDLDPTTDDKEDNGDNDDDDDDVKKESKHTTPKSDKEKKLAALAHPKDKITHKDVLVGRGVLKKEDVDVDSLTEEQLEEVLKKSDPAGTWVKDFVHSKDPKFAGKSKKERMKMALGAYYAKQRNEEVEEVDEAIKPYVSYSAGGMGKSPSATVMAANEKPHKTFTKTEHGHDYKQKAMDYFKKHGNKLKEEEQLDELEKSKYVDMVYKATDPSYGRGADHIIKRAGKEHGPKFAKDLEGIADKGHFPRRGHSSGRDPLKPYPGDTGPRITKAGKMHSADARVMKSKIGSRLGQHTKPNLPESEQLQELSPKTLGSYAVKVASLPPEKVKPSREAGIEKATKKLRKMREDVEFSFTDEEIERLETIAAQLDEAKPTVVSAPIRGANQDQSGFGVKNNTADYTISDSKKIKVKEETELEEGRGRPKKSGEEAEGDDTAKHPIQQLHKIAASIQGNEPHFEHKDGSKTKVSKQLAKHITAVYGSMRTTQEKDDFANKLHANRDSMMSAVDKHVR